MGKSFRLPIKDYNEVNVNIGPITRDKLFDENEEIQAFISRLLAPSVRKSNRLFYMYKNFTHVLSLSHDATVAASLTAFFSGRDWYVWGAELYGSRLKEFLDTIGVRICGFIDSSPEKQDKNVGCIKIYGWKDVACEARNVFIATKDKDATEQIKALVHDTAPSVSVYGFADLMDYAVRKMA